MATNQNEESSQNRYAWWKNTVKTFLKKSVNIPFSETAIKANFHFSHPLKPIFIFPI